MNYIDKYRPILDKVKRVWSWTTEAELAYLCEYAQGCSHILEIGSYVGKSAKCMLLANPNLKITSFDTWDDEGTHEEYVFNLREFKDRIRYKVGASHDNLITTSSGMFDGAFVDGGHLYDDVKGDISGVRRVVREGTIIVGHDYRKGLPEDGVTKAVREAFPDATNPVDSIWEALT